MTLVTHVTPAAQSRSAWAKGRPRSLAGTVSARQQRYLWTISIHNVGLGLYIDSKYHKGYEKGFQQVSALCLCSGGYKGYVGHARLRRRPAYPAARGGVNR